MAYEMFCSHSDAFAYEMAVSPRSSPKTQKKTGRPLGCRRVKASAGPEQPIEKGPYLIGSLTPFTYACRPSVTRRSPVHSPERFRIWRTGFTSANPRSTVRRTETAG
jgi:hypothetical protein